MDIKSTSATIQASAETVYTFLCDPANILHLLPKDKISEFTSDEHGCSFKVQGGILIPLHYTQRHPTSKINMSDGNKGPFPYHLAIHIDAKGENDCEGHIEFHGKVNMFMKMMVEKPLTSLFEYMTKQLQTQFSK